MTNTDTPSYPQRRLNDEEMNELDQLLARFPDSYSLEELDGLLCALVTGPVDVPPSTWLPVVVGAKPEEWGSKKDAERMTALIMQHWQAIVSSFREDWSGVDGAEGADLMFFPLLDDPAESGHPQAEGWARGFRGGLEWIKEEHWDALEQDEECVAILNIIGALDTGEKAPGEPVSAADREEIISPLAASLQYLYAFWRRWLRIVNAPRVPMRADEGPGRNDPCPCGSGKKYKKCCGAPEKLH